MRIEQTNTMDTRKLDAVYQIWYSSKACKRSRIILAVICALYFAGSIWFFLQKDVLTWLICALFGLVLSIFTILNYKVIQRNKMRKANAYAIGGKYSYIITDESIRIDAPRSKTEYDWSAVKTVHEFDDYIVIQFKQNAVTLLEKALLKEDEIAWLKNKKLPE